MPSTSSIRHPGEAVHNPVGRLTAEHPGVVKAGRAGWYAKGVVYLIAGILALSVAAKASGWSTSTSATGNQEASPTGAIKTVAGSPGGTAMLWLLALGMLLYAAWRVVSTLLPGDTDEGLGEARWLSGERRRLHHLRPRRDHPGRASCHDDPGRQREGHRHLHLDHGEGRRPAGDRRGGRDRRRRRPLPPVQGPHRGRQRRLDLSRMSPARARWTQRLGAVGEVGRGVGIGLVGFFMLRASITYDPKEATGLDGALRRVATESWGVVVVIVVGVGLAAYGIFCLATFTRRRLQAP